jgi:hypothetical protein
MAEGEKRGLAGYDIVGILMAIAFALAGVWLVGQRDWVHWGLYRTPSELRSLVNGGLVLMPLILAACLAIPGKCYGNRILHKAGSVATGIALGLTITAVGLSLAAIILGVIIKATFSDEQEASVICGMYVLVGIAVFLGACFFLGSAYVLKKKVGPGRILVIVGTLVTLLFLSGIAYAYFCLH